MPTTQRESLRKAARAIGLIARDRKEDFRFAQIVEDGYYRGFQETIRRKLNARSSLEIYGPGGRVRLSTLFEDDDQAQILVHAIFPITPNYRAVNNFVGLARGRGRKVLRFCTVAPGNC